MIEGREKKASKLVSLLISPCACVCGTLLKNRRLENSVEGSVNRDRSPRNDEFQIIFSDSFFALQKSLLELQRAHYGCQMGELKRKKKGKSASAKSAKYFLSISQDFHLFSFFHSLFLLLTTKKKENCSGIHHWAIVNEIKALCPVFSSESAVAKKPLTCCWLPMLLGKGWSLLK